MNISEVKFIKFSITIWTFFNNFSHFFNNFSHFNNFYNFNKINYSLQQSWNLSQPVFLTRKTKNEFFCSTIFTVLFWNYDNVFCCRESTSIFKLVSTPSTMPTWHKRKNFQNFNSESDNFLTKLNKLQKNKTTSG